MCAIQNEQSPPNIATDLQHDRHVLKAELEMQNEELRRIQVELEETRDRYIDLYDCAPIGFFSLNRDGVITEANLTCTELLGMERNKLINSRFEKFIAEGDKDRWYLHFLNVKRRVGKNVCELLMQPENGSTFLAHVDCQKLRLEDSDSVRFALIDITELKEAEAARDNMLKIIEDSPDYIGTMDLKGRFLFHNKSANRMLGLTEDADITMMELNDVHPAWAAEKVVKEGISTAMKMGFWRGDAAILDREGHETPVSQIIRLHCDVKQRPIFTTCQRPNFSTLSACSERFLLCLNR